MSDQHQPRGSYEMMAAEFIAGVERHAALNLPSLPDDPAERAAMRAAGYDVLAEVVSADGLLALVRLAGDDDEISHPVRARELAEALGAGPADLPGREFLAVVRETPEDGVVLSAFRPLPGA